MQKKFVLIILTFFFFVPRIFSEEKIRYIVSSDQKFDPIYNSIYTPVFQPVWDKVRTNVAQGDVKMFGAPELADVFNKSSITIRDFPRNEYFAKLLLGYEGDKTNDILTKIFKDKFGIDKKFDYDLNVVDSVGYSCLYKKIEFPVGFYDINTNLDFVAANGQKRTLKGFGISEYTNNNQWKIAEQITVLDYVDDDSFIVSVEMKAGDQELLIAKGVSGASFGEIYDIIKERLRDKESGKLLLGDSVLFPKIDIYYSHFFEEIQKKTVLNVVVRGWFFTLAFSDICFKFKPEKSADIDFAQSLNRTRNFRLQTGTESNRKFVLDKPFVVCLKKKDREEPYFMLWVADAQSSTIIS